MDLSVAWTEQIGMPHASATAVTQNALATLEGYIDIGNQFEFVSPRSTKTGVGYLVREPVGVVAAITPWNVPLSTMINKIGPALVAGCTVIMKPAPETPIEAYIIAEAADAAGFPPGVINLIVADRKVSDALVQNPGIDKVSFTGSVAAGRRIASVCGDRIARVTLELGGKSAAIILDDYDLATAASVLAPSLCALSGQNCAALTRVIVSNSRRDELIDMLIDQFRRIRVGRPYDAQTQMGPLATQRQLGRVKNMIERGVNEGARLVFGGGRPQHLENGCYIEPALFADVESRMSIAQEEIFGPVMCVIASDGEDDAVRIANDSSFGLAGAVFTNDVERAYRLGRRIRTGTVSQNGLRVDFSIGFGGFKQSGLGREGGEVGLQSYLESKTLLLTNAPNTP